MESPRHGEPTAPVPVPPPGDRGEDPAVPGAPERWSFELRVRPYGEAGFRVHLLSSPAGDEVGDLDLPGSARDVHGVLAELQGSVSGRRRHLHPGPPAERLGVPGGRRGTRLEALGEALFEALFPPAIRRRWDDCVEEIGERPGRGLRLVLKSDPACAATADLQRLPWELLRDPRKGAFLALSRKTTVVRQLALDDLPPVEAPRAAARLRILAVLSCPSGLAPLDLPRERRRIEEAVAERPEIELTVLEDPTFARLTEALRGGAFHVLHFMGHGTFDRRSGRGYLLLSGADGRPAPLAGERLAQVARDSDSVGLVFLNACETGRAAEGGEEPFAGLAHALIRCGIPAVLAMQLPVPDRAAVELSRVFYRRLAAGESVDEALAEARVAVYAAEETGAAGAWAVPALFVRRPELRLFRPRRSAWPASGGGAHRGPARWRRWWPAAALSLLTVAIVALFFVPAPWAGVELEAVASRVTFTLDEPRSVVDALDLVELAVPSLWSLRHPDPGGGADRTVRADVGAPEGFGFLAAVSGAGSGGLTLDDACLPAGTRVELERVGPRDLRLALEPPAGGDSRCGDQVTASVGPGATLRLVPGPSEPVDLGAGGRLVMVPRDRRMVLDLTLAHPALTRFHSPLLIADLRFFEVREEPIRRSSTLREVSTLTGGKLTLRPLGGGEPATKDLEPEEPISLDGLRGRITTLALQEPDLLRVHFRGRVEGITGRDADGEAADLMPTWSQSPWVVRLGAAASVLVAALGLFGQLGGVLRWTGTRGKTWPYGGPVGPESY